MPRNLTAQDRSALIRLARSLPAGSPQRKAILAGLNRQGAYLTSRPWAFLAQAVFQSYADYERMGRMTPFSNWYKGEHGRLQSQAKANTRNLIKLLKESDDPEEIALAAKVKAWHDYAFLGGNLTVDLKDIRMDIEALR